MIPFPLFALACVLLVVTWTVLPLLWLAYRDLQRAFDRQGAELADLKGRPAFTYVNDSRTHTTEAGPMKIPDQPQGRSGTAADIHYHPRGDE